MYNRDMYNRDKYHQGQFIDSNGSKNIFQNMRPVGYLMAPDKKNNMYLYEYKSPFDGFHYIVKPFDEERKDMVFEIDRT